ncbi:WD40-repeat-containing domain protein [Rhodocollybia butyracea]|uniref:WD40-repeat-containing domain protein n=1 Tax=Rhodocollybia butyracea TaxID=206335 RepID=A0A9P5Q970_9AGAR|nr:WD40-repeat-containing domain protein [Rhodocollybia butyracea]
MTLKDSRFGKRLRASHSAGVENSPRKKRRRIDIPTSPTKSPSKRTQMLTDTLFRRQKPRPNFGAEDRFVPLWENSSLKRSYNLEDKASTTKFFTDPAKDQANHLFESVLRSELHGSPSSFHSTPSPSRSIFGQISPTNSQCKSSPDYLDNPTGVAYQLSPLHQKTRTILSQHRPHIRAVAKDPSRTLDLPDLPDDFYTNLVDWSPSGVLGVGLEREIYLWREQNSTVSKLCSISGKDSYCSLAWMKTSPMIAVGTHDGHLKIYDASTLSLVRTLENAAPPVDPSKQRISSLSWTSTTLSSGSRDSTVKHWDIRESSARPYKTSIGHKLEVSGLRWNGDDGPHVNLLASGGNDNKVCIWDHRGSARNSGCNNVAGSSGSVHDRTSGLAPLSVYRHTACIKGLAWSTHTSGLLASGGGTGDHRIRFFNTTTGKLVNEIDTGSQVCNLVWSKNTNEIVSTHGFSCLTVPNQICIWKYPTMRMVSSLRGHSDRVQHIALSPDGNTIATASSDETLRFWEIFPNRHSVVNDADSVLNYGKLIR